MTELPVCALAFDDLCLRDEWASLPTISDRRMSAKLDMRVLDLADRFRLRGTIFVSGSTAQKFPALVKELVQRGHEVAGHGMLHEDLRRLNSSRRVKEVISMTLMILDEHSGSCVRGWKHPGLFEDAKVRRGLSRSAVNWCAGSKIPLAVARLGCSLLPFEDYGSKVEIPSAWEATDYDLYVRFGFSANRLTKYWEKLPSRFPSSVLVFTVHPWLHLLKQDRFKALGRVFENFQSNGEFMTEGEIYEMFKDGRIRVSSLHQSFLRVASRASEMLRNQITARPDKSPCGAAQLCSQY